MILFIIQAIILQLIGLFAFIKYGKTFIDFISFAIFTIAIGLIVIKVRKMRQVEE